MAATRASLVMLAVFATGCDRNTDEDCTGISTPAIQRISVAEERLARAHEALEAFPKLDLMVRVTRSFVILRQVEILDDTLDWRTREELGKAKRRASALLARLSAFVPHLRKIQGSFMRLRCSLHNLIGQKEIDAGSRMTILQARSQIGRAIDDLDFAIRVIGEPESVFPGATECFEPDFTDWHRDLETALRDARSGIAQ